MVCEESYSRKHTHKDLRTVQRMKEKRHIFIRSKFRLIVAYRVFQQM